MRRVLCWSSTTLSRHLEISTRLDSTATERILIRTITHRYGDGTWELIRRAINAVCEESDGTTTEQEAHRGS